VGIEGAPPPPGFDTTRTYVQVVDRRADGFVEFRFSIGDPSLFVEMLLTEAAFDEFCALNGCEDVAVAEATGGGPEIDEWDWTLRDATHRRFK
jgi:phenol hydroxylase P0 protein